MRYIVITSRAATLFFTPLIIHLTFDLHWQQIACFYIGGNRQKAARCKRPLMTHDLLRVLFTADERTSQVDNKDCINQLRTRKRRRNRARQPLASAVGSMKTFQSIDIRCGSKIHRRNKLVTGQAKRFSACAPPPPPSPSSHATLVEATAVAAAAAPRTSRKQHGIVEPLLTHAHAPSSSPPRPPTHERPYAYSSAGGRVP